MCLISCFAYSNLHNRGIYYSTDEQSNMSIVATEAIRSMHLLFDTKSQLLIIWRGVWRT